MKLNATLMIPALLGALLLTACGDKKEEAAEANPAPAAEAPAETAPAAEAAPAGPGGYEPTAEERVPGITLDPEAPAEAAPEATPETAAE